MTRKTNDDWKPWHNEIKRYAARETEGLNKDLAALEAHIKKLREVAPKDDVGCTDTTALIYLNRTQNRLDEVKKYLAAV